MRFEDAVSRRGALGLVGAAGVAAFWHRSANGQARTDRIRFARTAAVMQGQAGQIFVARAGSTLLDEGHGAVPAGVPIRPTTLVPWASAVKPTTAAAVMRLVETGRVALRDPVVKFIPEFAAHGKADVLIEHLLNHSAHLGGYGGPIGLPSFAEVIRSIAAAPRELARSVRGGAQSGSVPASGTVPAYNPAGIWILGEVLQRVHRRPFDAITRSEIYEPCGMVDSWNGMSTERRRTYGDRAAVLGVGPLALRSGGRAARGFGGRNRSGSLMANPAGGGVGPSRDLGRFYQMLLDGGTIGGRRILRAETVRRMTTLTLSDGRAFAWGLGLNLNLTPGGGIGGQRFGTKASRSAFGHAGASGISAFADPAHGLVVVAIPAGETIDAIYEDLAIARADAARDTGRVGERD